MALQFKGGKASTIGATNADKRSVLMSTKNRFAKIKAELSGLRQDYKRGELWKADGYEEIAALAGYVEDLIAREERRADQLMAQLQ